MPNLLLYEDGYMTIFWKHCLSAVDWPFCVGHETPPGTMLQWRRDLRHIFKKKHPSDLGPEKTTYTTSFFWQGNQCFGLRREVWWFHFWQIHEHFMNPKLIQSDLLTIPKGGHLTIPKRSLWITWNLFWAGQLQSSKSSPSHFWSPGPGSCAL